MTRINLLPWREEKRELEKKQFYAMLIGGMGVALFIVSLFYIHTNSLISEQELVNQRLNAEITNFNHQITQISALKKLRQALISRMNIIRNLQSTRLLTVHLLDELVHVLPDGVYLTKIERNGDSVNIFGRADSNTNVSNLMRKIERNEWIHNPVLTEIKKTPLTNDAPNTDISNNEFQLSFTMAEPNIAQGVKHE